MTVAPSPETLPRVVVAYGVSDAPAAEALERALAQVSDVTLRRDDQPAGIARACDLAIFVIGPTPAPGLLLRLGIYLGALGRERIMVWPLAGAEITADLESLVLVRHVQAIKDHLAQLPEGSRPEPKPPVARRLRRSLGTASSAQHGGQLRIADISASGALLETFGEIPENQILDLDVTLGNGRKIRVAARVVRIQHPQWGRVGGVGVQFVRFEGASKAILEDYLDAGAAALAAMAFHPGMQIPEA